jgi:hypothetical protein
VRSRAQGYLGLPVSPSFLPARSLPPWLEATLAGLLALGLYLATQQAAMHGTDWRWLLLWAGEPQTVHPQHPGYLPGARLLAVALQPLGFGLPQVLQVYSALGGALAVAGSYLAGWALHGERRLARWTAALVAVLPAWWHFATVIELHAPFLGLASLAIACGVRALSRPLAPGAWWVATGGLLGVATLVHATGHLLLPAMLLALAWAARAQAWRSRLLAAAGLVVGHGLAYGVGFWCLRATGSLPASVTAFAEHAPDDLAAPDHPLAYLARWWRDMEFAAQWGPTLWVEWLQAYAPFCLLVLVAAWQPRLRVWLWLLLVTVAVYLLATVALVHAVTDERGAYLVPLGLPLVLLVLQALPRRALPVLLGLAVVAGALLRGEPGRLPAELAFGRAAAAMAKQQPTVFFVADLPEMDGAFLVDPRLRLRVARKEHDDLRAAQQQLATFQPTAEQVAAWLLLITAEARQQGAVLVITEVARAWLAAQMPAFAAAWQAYAAMVAPEPLPAASGIAGVLVR